MRTSNVISEDMYRAVMPYLEYNNLILKCCYICLIYYNL